MTSQVVVRVAAPVREEAMRLLRAEITTGALGPGERLSEVDVGARLQVSRTTVREAFRQLEAERLIEVIPGKGPVVASIGPQEAAEIYQIREALEGLAVRLFTARHTDDELAALQQALARLETAYAGQDIAEILPVKDAFYDVLYRGARNLALGSMARGLAARVARLRAASLAVPGRPQAGLREMHALVGAVQRRDEDEAVRLCQAHVRNAAAAAASSNH